MKINAYVYFAITLLELWTHCSSSTAQDGAGEDGKRIEIQLKKSADIFRLGRDIF